MRSAFRGIGYYSKAISILFQYNLWTYFLVPSITSLILIFTVFKTRSKLVDPVQSFIGNLYPESWIGSNWIGGALDWLGGAVGEILVWGLLLLLMKHIVMIVASPFMSLLSERVEQIVTGKKSGGFQFQKFISDIIRGIRVALRLLVRELFWSFIVFLLSFFLPPITAILLFLIQAYYGGAGNFDFTLERYYGYRASVQFVKENRSAALGNGIPYIALLMTIFGFLVALPLATVAGTLQTLELIHGTNQKRID